MLSSQPAHLRSALICLKFQPTLITPCNAASTSSSTTTASPVQRRFHGTTHQISLHRPSPHTKTPFQSPKPRFLSSATTEATTSPSPTHQTTTTTTTTIPSPSPHQQPPLTTSTTPSQNQLTWNAFLSLRHLRRRYSLLSSLTGSLTSTVVCASYVVNSHFELEDFGLFGLDPLMVMGLCVVGSGGVGWLLGPFVGNAVFGLRYRGLRGEIERKEKDLYARIKKHRVDPSGGSSANPVPDYYGEKIGSVQGYRNWMKDQRAFNKKRQNFL